MTKPTNIDPYYEIVKNALNNQLRPYDGSEINDNTIEHIKQTIEEHTKYKINNMWIDGDKLMVDFSVTPIVNNITFDYENYEKLNERKD